MAQIGINPSLFIKSVSVNEQYGSLDVIVADRVEAAPTGEVDLLDSFTSVSTSAPSNETRMSVYLPNVEYNGESFTAERITQTIQGIQQLLTHILLQGKLAPQYVAVIQKDRTAFINDNLKFTGIRQVIADLGLTKENMAERILDKAVVDAMVTSYFTDFVRLFAEQQVAEQTQQHGVRGIFVRQSKNKPYAALRTSYVLDNPIFEREDLIPVEKSKLKFSKYEISKGLDSADKVTADAPGAGAEAVEELFKFN